MRPVCERSAGSRRAPAGAASRGAVEARGVHRCVRGRSRLQRVCDGGAHGGANADVRHLRPTVHGPRSTAYGSRLTVHDDGPAHGPRPTAHGPRLTARGPVHGPRRRSATAVRDDGPVHGPRSGSRSTAHGPRRWSGSRPTAHAVVRPTANGSRSGPWPTTAVRPRLTARGSRRWSGPWLTAHRPRSATAVRFSCVRRPLAPSSWHSARWRSAC